MITNRYVLDSGKISLSQDGPVAAITGAAEGSECWYDIQDPSPAELRQLLGPLNLHPLMLGRCLDRASTPGVISCGSAVLMEYPVAVNLDEPEPSYLTFIIQLPVLVTIQHNSIPGVTRLLRQLSSEGSPGAFHLVQCVHLLLDELTDASVKAQTDTRDRILKLARTMAENPALIRDRDLSEVRWRLDRLASLVEDQLYCVTGLAASDSENLQEPHRKAYLQDMVSEAEIAQRGIYSLEGRVNALYAAYQSIGNSRVEKRLRILTIISAVALPFGLIAGLLGMNVGGLPWLNDPYGFAIVILLMVVIAIAELCFFKWKGWFD